MNNEEDKISNIEWGFAIGVAVFIDLIQALLALLLIGLILNRFITVIVWLSAYLWLKISGVKRFGKILTSGGVLEVIPILGAFPFWTGAIIAIMIKEKAKNVLPGPAAKLATKSI